MEHAFPSKAYGCGMQGPHPSTSHFQNPRFLNSTARLERGIISVARFPFGLPPRLARSGVTHTIARTWLRWIEYRQKSQWGRWRPHLISRTRPSLPKAGQSLSSSQCVENPSGPLVWLACQCQCRNSTVVLTNTTVFLISYASLGR